MALWEVLAPRRQLRVAKPHRWLNNLALVAFNSVALRLLFPATAVATAAFAHAQGWGLINYFETPYVVGLLLAMVALDGVIYLQHVMFHSVPVLWRIHRVHHADLDYDVTTGLRFHPIEIVLSLMVKCAAILLLGPPVTAVVLFEILLNATSLFNHGNVSLPGKTDRVLRWLVVTPDMHRVHHSVEDDEANSNFGFNLPWWDRLFGTYREAPRGGHVKMVIGIRGCRDTDQTVPLPALLLQPFRGDTRGYAINRQE
ncbi:MAG: sterol desaturase family protein [Halioglobus sp.]|nr:sterol desaturase family protein [Halioglobus sp.]